MPFLELVYLSLAQQCLPPYYMQSATETSLLLCVHISSSQASECLGELIDISKTNELSTVFEFNIKGRREILMATEKPSCMYCSFCTVTGFVVDRVVVEPISFQ
jgi:hypothetical protein